jgi:hypothetical protein
MKAVPSIVLIPTCPSRAKVLIRRLRASILVREISDAMAMFSIEQCQIVASITMVVMHVPKLHGSGHFPLKDIEE